MVGIKNLDTLLYSMKPELVKGEYVFFTISEKQNLDLDIRPILMFKEKEGVTIILEKSVADKKLLKYTSTFAMITLTVHSDLNAIGFLAAITSKLAENNISVNAVSAYYHDHLFVPYTDAKKAILILNELSKRSK